MRDFLILVCFFYFSNSICQTIEKTIILKDADTSLPISDATVVIAKTRQTFLSNSEGNVSFELKGASNIQISHISYASQTLKSIMLKESTNVIYLKSNLNNIEEIIITKVHPQKILKNVIENSIKKLSIPARLKVYSREFFKLNDAYSYYNDGLMNFQISRSGGNFNTDILIEQNRSLGLIDEEISSDLLGYDLNNIMENYYEFKYLDELFDSKARKNYMFFLNNYAPNDKCYVLKIYPTDEAKGYLYEFEIVYDKKLKIILEINSRISQNALSKVEDKTDANSKNIYKSNFKMIYRFDGTDYYLLSSREEIGFERIDKKKVKKDIEVRNYFITTNFSNQRYSYKEEEVFKDKTLFNTKNKILSNYWDFSGLTATDEELQIINRIAEEHKED